MDDERHAFAAVLARNAQADQAQIGQTAQVLSHRRRHFDVTLVRSPESIDFNRARRYLVADVVAGHRQRLAPACGGFGRPHGVVGLRIERYQSIPVDDLLVIEGQVSVGVEVVVSPHGGAYSSKNLRPSAIDGAGS